MYYLALSLYALALLTLWGGVGFIISYAIARRIRSSYSNMDN